MTSSSRSARWLVSLSLTIAVAGPVPAAAQQPAEVEARLKKLLRQSPEAGTNGDGKPTMEAAQAAKSKVKGASEESSAVGVPAAKARADGPNDGPTLGD